MVLTAGVGAGLSATQHPAESITERHATPGGEYNRARLLQGRPPSLLSKLQETGTACVLCPILTAKYKAELHELPDGP